MQPAVLNVNVVKGKSAGAEPPPPRPKLFLLDKVFKSGTKTPQKNHF
jgi:hypothetical protein